MVLRLDVTKLDASKIRPTPQGGLLVGANLTRTGVLVYKNADGSERREYRPPKEVFDEDSLESFRLAPLTVGHPGFVSPANFKQVSVGVVDTPRADDRFVGADVRVQDAAAVDAVNKRELVELSCGYTCDVDPTPGVSPDGEKYDCVQRNIRGNHVALLPRGEGRAGAQVALRLDGKDEAYTRDMADANDALRGELDGAKARAAAAEARADAAEKALKAVDVEALVQDRIALVQDAQKCGVAEPKGTASEIMRAAVAKAFPSLKLDDKSSDEYVAGLFRAAVESAPSRKVAEGNLRVDAESAGKDPIAEARKRNEERSRNAHKAGSK